MREPTVAQIMTTRVVTAMRDTPFRELASLLTSSAVGAVPVIDTAGRPLGLVTETDLLAKLEFHGGVGLPPLFANGDTRKRWRKAAAVTAAGLLTEPAACVRADVALSGAVRVLAGCRLPLLCVVDDAGRAEHAADSPCLGGHRHARRRVAAPRQRRARRLGGTSRPRRDRRAQQPVLRTRRLHDHRALSCRGLADFVKCQHGMFPMF